MKSNFAPAGKSELIVKNFFHTPIEFLALLLIVRSIEFKK